MDIIKIGSLRLILQFLKVFDKECGLNVLWDISHELQMKSQKPGGTSLAGAL